MGFLNDFTEDPIMKRLIRVAAAALSLSIFQTLAQGYPSKPVHVIIGFTAGTATDIIARVLSQ